MSHRMNDIPRYAMFSFPPTLLLAKNKAGSGLYTDLGARFSNTTTDSSLSEELGLGNLYSCPAQDEPEGV